MFVRGKIQIKFGTDAPSRHTIDWSSLFSEFSDHCRQLGSFLCVPQLSREARDHPEASLRELGLHRGQGPGVRCWMSLSQLVRSLCLLITSVCELSDDDNLDKWHTKDFYINWILECLGMTIECCQCEGDLRIRDIQLWTWEGLAVWESGHNWECGVVRHPPSHSLSTLSVTLTESRTHLHPLRRSSPAVSNTADWQTTGWLQTRKNGNIKIKPLQVFFSSFQLLLTKISRTVNSSL